MAASMGSVKAQEPGLTVAVDDHGNYAISAQQVGNAILVSGVAVQVGGQWIHSSDYPKHVVEKSASEGFLGQAEQWQVTFSGLAGKPDLMYTLRRYESEPFVDVQATVSNTSKKTVDVERIRVVEASGAGVPELGGTAASDRVLSDSFSEDRPAMQIHDLGDPLNGMHRAVGSQMLYNRESRESLFIGALSSERFLTILRLHVNVTGSAPQITNYEVDSTGTTEMQIEKENSLEHSPAADRVELRLSVTPGEKLSSETVVISAGMDYHQQLEAYGSLIRKIHKARVTAPPLMGWWSWTAYYSGLNEGAALTNAAWEAQHLKSFGYDVFHIDEGYQYARGEYITPDATLFPHGLEPVEYQVRGFGLMPGIWTAPFEVSGRSAVYQKHRDWLVKNADGQPIQIRFIGATKEHLYVLDTTNPGAQNYLRETYSKLVRQWGVRYIKMDFMEDSAIEGYFFKPHTTAMEAQRIGLGIIRDTVGENVYLDKDGGVMLNPVGYVDYGRLSLDTGHSFEASRDAETGIAARYYMNRNFYVSDPDAFTVSTQRITDQSWHVGKEPLTLDEAKVSIALAATSGGMLEIGDDLPALQGAPDRVALIENEDLIDMVRLGRASVPVDLMTYTAPERQPSIFYLKESGRQSILSVFNWTEQTHTTNVRFTDLGLTNRSYAVTDIFEQKQVEGSSGTLSLELPAHSVRVLKIIDREVPAIPLEITATCVDAVIVGKSVELTATVQDTSPALAYRWDFGDGVQLDGAHVRHAWTAAGDYEVRVVAAGLDGTHSEKTCKAHVTGYQSTRFSPEQKQRYEPK